MVVKIGSSTLTNERGTFRLAPVAGLVAEVCELHAAGPPRCCWSLRGPCRRAWASSGASAGPTEVVDLQAAAAVGQGRLFHIYTELFAHENVVTAQVLLTAFDVAARTQYLNARNTLKRLLEWRVVPIINENDTTSTDELCFGDNDALAAQVALLVKADLLVLLTDTDGLYTADPREDPDARLITTVEDLGELECVQIGAVGPLGSGGMGSKVNSARIATSGGVETVIARGTRPGVLRACLAGEEVGTRFPPRPLGLPDYKLWLLYGKPARGKVVVDAGAAKALRGKGSLLPVGVIGGGGRLRRGRRGHGRRRRGRPNWPRVWSATPERNWSRVKGLQSGRVAEMLPAGFAGGHPQGLLVLVC